jgi:hypothetical protein
MLIRHKKMFNLGVLLAISFLGVLALIFSPIFGGVNGLDYADNLFNKLSKGSSYFIPKLMKSDEKYLGTQFKAAIKLDKPEQVEKSVKILTVAGAQVSATGADLTISGDLGNLLSNVLKDADAMYHNNGTEVANRYGFDAKEVLSQWWNILTKMDKTFKKELKIEESKAVSEVVKKAVETAYNFYGIEAQKVSDKAFLMIALLVFYVIYTMWWGYAIFYMFDGIGLSMKKAKVKKEV